jgi:hypothetical protein
MGLTELFSLVDPSILQDNNSTASNLPLIDYPLAPKASDIQD